MSKQSDKTKKSKWQKAVRKLRKGSGKRSKSEPQRGGSFHISEISRHTQVPPRVVTSRQQRAPTASKAEVERFSDDESEDDNSSDEDGASHAPPMRSESMSLRADKARNLEYKAITGNVLLENLSVVPAANIEADFRHIFEKGGAGISATAIRRLPEAKRHDDDKRWLAAHMVLNFESYALSSAHGGAITPTEAARVKQERRAVRRSRLMAWLALEELSNDGATRVSSNLKTMGEESPRGSSVADSSAEPPSPQSSAQHAVMLIRRLSARSMKTLQRQEGQEQKRMQSGGVLGSPLPSPRAGPSTSRDPWGSTAGDPSTSSRIMRRTQSMRLDMNEQSNEEDEENEAGMLTDEEDEEDVARSEYRGITGNVSRADLTMRPRDAMREAEERTPAQRARRASNAMEMSAMSSAMVAIRAEFAKGNITPEEFRAMESAMSRAKGVNEEDTAVVRPRTPSPRRCPPTPPLAGLASLDEEEEAEEEGIEDDVPTLMAEFNVELRLSGRLSRCQSPIEAERARAEEESRSAVKVEKNELPDAGWFIPDYGDETLEHGPYPITDLQRWVDDGHFGGADLCWHGSGGSRVAMRTVVRCNEPDVTAAVDDVADAAPAEQAAHADADASPAVDDDDDAAEVWICVEYADHGPYSVRELRSFLAEGHVHEEDLYKRCEEGTHAALRDIVAPAVPAPASASAVPAGGSVKPQQQQPPIEREEWFYPDHADPESFHGPFSLEQLGTWYHEGYFEDGLQVRRTLEGIPAPLASILTLER